MELEERVRKRAATSDERLAVIAEPIDALAYAHSLDIEAGARRSASAVIQLLALVATCTMVISVGMCFQIKPDPSTKWVALISTLFALPMIALVVQRMRNDGHAVGKKFLRPLARSLREVRPTEAELESAIAALARSGNRLAASMSPAELYQRVQAEALRV